MGVLGFLVVITVLRKARIPQRYKVHLIQTIFIMIVFGVLGAQFIDNAAHRGGFLVGMFLGVLLVPRQELIWEHRPGKTIVALGWASWAVLAASCVQVAQLILR